MKKMNDARRSTKASKIRDERLFRGLSAFIEAEHEMTRGAIGRRLDLIEVALSLVVREVWPDLKIAKVKSERQKDAV